MKDILLDALSCLVCSKNEIVQGEPDKLLCRNCGRNFLIKNSIPVLLKNPKILLSDVEKHLKENPNWYNDNQIKYADEGPYRHHLRKRVGYLFSVFNKYSFNSPKILDAGCGDGINLRHLVTIANSTVFGIDYNLIRLFRAQVNCDGKAFLVLGSLLEKTFQEEYFDIILCNHVLEHIEDDLGVLLNLHRMLEPKGILILGVPNEGAFLWQLNYRLIQQNIMKTTDHIHFYTVKDIQALLDKSNFVLEEVKHMGWGVPHTRIDVKLRQYKWIDDLFDIGRWLCKSQATSLYFICRKGI